MGKATHFLLLGSPLRGYYILLVLVWLQNGVRSCVPAMWQFRLRGRTIAGEGLRDYGLPVTFCPVKRVFDRTC